jgi:ribosomal subunit interface protein
MKINIESPHLEIAVELEQSIRAQCTRLKKIYDRITSCEVVLRKVKNDHQKNCEVEARLLIPKSSFFALARAESFEMAIKNAMEDLLKQLKSEKEGRQETW